MKKYNRTMLSVLVILVMLLTVALPQAVNAAAQSGVVKVDSYLNVRDGAGSSYSTIGKLSNNQPVNVVDTVIVNGQKWYKIEYNDGYGYVSADYVALTDSDFDSYLNAQGFPESYRDGLRALHSAHPNWIFVAQNITPDWNTVMKNESKVGYNLVPSSSIASHKSFEKGAFDWNNNTWYKLDGSWVAASYEIIAWAMDPRNFLTESYVFQFEKLKYVSTHTVSGVKAILSGTFMDNKFPDASFDTYADAIMAAAKESGVSAYHLASRLKQEQGSKGNPLAWGTVSGYEGYYNFFNINTYDTSSASMYTNGAAYAKRQGWNTPYKAILGGSKFLASSYIAKEQDTLYLQKFDVIDGGNGYYTHQYMTNVFAPSNEASRMKSAYTSEILSSALVFYIPVYKNMPASACVKPTSKGNNNNLLDSLSVKGYTITPTFERYTYDYSLVIESNSVKSVTINATTDNKTAATVSGTGTFKLNSGHNVAELVVTAPSGVKRSYFIDITLKTSTAAPSFSTKYSIGKFITGVAPETEVSDFITGLGLSGGTARVYGTDQKQLTSGNVGTGCTVRIYNNEGVETSAHTVVIYGDNNGDGTISILDLVRIQKHLLGTAQHTGEVLEACDVNRDGEVTILDLVKEQKHLLGTGEIKQ